MGSRAGNRPWLREWSSLKVMMSKNGVGLSLLQASARDDHGVLCRYRRLIGKREPVRCRRDGADRSRGEGSQRARGADRLVQPLGARGDADWAGGWTAVAMAVCGNAGRRIGGRTARDAARPGRVQDDA